METDGSKAVIKEREIETFTSRATAVTFFEDRAEVTRFAEIALNQKSGWVALSGVSPFVDERTVSARVVSGPGSVRAARVRWHAHRNTAIGSAEMEELRAEERASRQTFEAASRARERGERRVDQINALHTKWAADAAKVARGAREEAKRETWRTAWNVLAAAIDEAHKDIAAATSDRDFAEEAMHRAAMRLREGAMVTPHYEATIEVDLAAEGAEDDGVQTVGLEVVYRVPFALWRPEHKFRLTVSTANDPPKPGAASAAESTGTVEILTWATAWHAAGETWENVRARFSTARPAADASPPLLRDDVLHLRRKTAEERSHVMVEAREQTQQTAGIERGVRAVEEMPGVEDGGEPLFLEASEPLTILGNGRPFRVVVGKRTLPCSVDRVLYPELNGALHVRVTATLTGTPLLAGPVQIAREKGIVGKSKVGFIAPGEPFEMGFGADDGVRSRRHVEEQRDTTAIIGTQKIKRKVDIFLSNLSREAKTLKVTERVPVSEIEDVEISITDAGDFGARNAEGFLHANIALTANETRRISFSYEIRAGSNVVLSF